MIPMSVALVQLLLCLGAGYFLWRLWRAFDGEDRFVRTVVFVGFAGRALAGTALFWISWLRLPIARSLQIGDGLWFFALDARVYMPNAAAAAHEGLRAILNIPKGSASVTYVQSLAVFLLLFGIVASVALLLNLFCYLGTCLILTKLQKSTPAARIPALIALTAISLSPSGVLWSLQPLKDTFFQFLIIAFVGGCVLWQRAWQSRPAAVPLLTAAFAMFATLFAMGGIRWYFALAVLGSALAFLLLNGVTAARPWKARALAAGALLFVAISQAFVLGAGPYAPPRLTNLLSLKRTGERRLDALSPSTFIRDIRQLRTSFELAGGATSIGVGGKLARLERPQPAPVPTATAAPVAPTPAPPKIETVARNETPAVRTEPPSIPAAAPVEPPRTATVSHEPPRSVAPAHPHPPTSTAAAAVPARVPPPAPPHAATSTHEARPTSKAEAPAPRTEEVKSVTTPPPVQKPASPEQRAAEEKSKSQSRPAPQAPQAKPRQPTVSQPKPAPVVPAPVIAAQPARIESQRQPAPQPAPSQPAPAPIVLPASTNARLTSGAVAVLIPRTIASNLGLVDIRGGKGLLWFTDLDTVFFDLVVLTALGFLLFHFRRATPRNPTFWFLALLALFLAGPLIYTVTNFGTLFRLRMMVYTAVALIPLALAMAAARSETAPSEITAAVADEPGPLPEVQPSLSDR